MQVKDAILRDGKVMHGWLGVAIQRHDSPPEPGIAGRKGKKIRIELSRDGKDSSFDVALGELPAESCALAASAQQTEANGLFAAVGVQELDAVARTRMQIAPSARGVVVTQVEPDTPADAAGLHGIAQTSDGITLGDIVVGIGGSPVGSYDDFYNALDEHHAGDALDVEILRAGGVVTSRVTLITIGPSAQGPD